MVAMGIAAPRCDAGLLRLPLITRFLLGFLAFDRSPPAAHGTLPSAIAFPARARLGAGPAKDTSAITPVAAAGAEAKGADVRARGQEVSFRPSTSRRRFRAEQETSAN